MSQIPDFLRGDSKTKILVEAIESLEERVTALEEANSGPLEIVSITPNPTALGDWLTVLCNQKVNHANGQSKASGLIWYSDPDGDKQVIIGTYGSVNVPEDFMSYARPDQLYTGHWFVYLALDAEGTQSESYVEVDILEAG